MAPSGNGSRRSPGWMTPSPSVARTSSAMAARAWPSQAKVHWRHVSMRVGRREPGLLPCAVVDADLDRVDAAVLRPGDAADGDRSGGDRGQRPRRVDARHRLDRRLARPAALDPVRVEGVERRQLELDQPLGGRHVAVQAGHEHPDRDSRARRAAARRSCRRRASRRGRRGRPRSACRWSCRRSSATTSWSAPALDAGLARGRSRAARRSSGRCRRTGRRPGSRRRTG